MEAPELHVAFDIHQRLAHLVLLPVMPAVLVDALQHFDDGIVLVSNLAEVPINGGVRQRQADAMQMA